MLGIGREKKRRGRRGGGIRKKYQWSGYQKNYIDINEKCYIFQKLEVYNNNKKKKQQSPMLLTHQQQHQLRQRAASTHLPLTISPRPTSASTDISVLDALDMRSVDEESAIHTSNGCCPNACCDFYETCTAKCKWNWKVVRDILMLLNVTIIACVLLYILWLVVQIGGGINGMVTDAGDMMGKMKERAPAIFNTTDRVLSLVNSVVDAQPDNFTGQLYQTVNDTSFMISRVRKNWMPWEKHINQTFDAIGVITPEDVDILRSNVQQLLIELNRSDINGTATAIKNLVINVLSIYNSWQSTGSAAISVDLGSILGLQKRTVI